MSITYGSTLTRSWGGTQRLGNVLMKAHTTHTDESDVFLSYQHSDQPMALDLARDLDRMGKRVFIDVHDDTLLPGQPDLDDALVTAIGRSHTMIVIVSDDTQHSWWVPWEIGVSTPSRKPKALYKPQANQPLPRYLEKLPRLQNSMAVDVWIGVRSWLQRQQLGDSR